MPALAKTPRIKIEFTDGKSRRLYLVPRETALIVRDILESAETKDDDFVSAQEIFPDLADPKKTPGIALRGVRLRLGLNQKAMAGRIGVSQGDLSKMERGERSIGKKLALRIGSALKVNYRRFL